METLSIPTVKIAHRNFSLTIPEMMLEPGEIIGVFGKSGAGKTSYLKRIRELFHPMQVHYLSQFDGLLEEITIRQYIELGLTAMKCEAADVRDWEQTHASLLRDFEVDRHLSRYPRAMSGGQRKRAEIVTALIMDPPLLLLDEPFLGIGHLFEAICTREILARGERRKGATIIVSHDFDLLCTFSRRILLVDDQGVIGFVPSRDPDWRPTNLRTAWTLGVENILTAENIHSLNAGNLEPPEEGKALGFWDSEAMWSTEGNCATVTVKRSDIASVRSSLRHGTLTSTVTLKAKNEREAVRLTAKGIIEPNAETIRLGVNNVWILIA